MAYDASSCYFRLSLSNQYLEEKLELDEKSSAGNMSLILDDEVNLQEAIYLKSLAAECALEDFTLSNLPNTFSRHESIGLQFEIEPGLSSGNAILTEDLVKERNNTICRIQMSDFITTSASTAINHVNSLVEKDVNFFLLTRYAEFLCDTDIFKKEFFTNAQPKPTEQDMALLLWYVEVGLYTRLQLIANINELLLAKDKKDVGDDTTFHAVQTLTSAIETKIIADSKMFRLVAKRTNVNNRLVNFNLLFNKDLSDMEAVLPSIAQNVTEYVTSLGFLTRGEDGNITEESSAVLMAIRDNNIAILQQSDLIYEILKIEKRKANSSSGMGLNSVYKNEMLQLSPCATPSP